jgi:FkbM family methyltransferase
MYLKVKNIIEDLTGFYVYRKGTPWGTNLYNDISRLVPKWSPRLILDVGGNVGQTAFAFNKAWPNAKIFSFEPVKDTFAILKKSIQNINNVEAVPLALGSVSGEGTIKLFSDSQNASLDNRFALNPNTKHENIRISTVDDFCLLHSINEVDILKIDAEGYDLEVLKGSASLLKNGKIDFVFTEISTTSRPGKVSLSDMNDFLRKYNMSFVGFYDQAFSICPGANFYYGNALFVREALLF